MRRLVFCALLLALPACSGTQTAAQGSGSGQTQGADTVIAEFGGRKITLKELEDKWQALDPAGRANATQQLYQNRRNVLNRLVEDLLIDDAAKAAGMPAAQYLEQETKKRIQPITDADIKQFFEANKDRTEGRTLDELRGPINDFLRNQREQQARTQLVADLKTKSGANLRVLLDPPRQTIELALHDPAIGPQSAPVTIVEFSDYQ
jgi:hypothetical protein